MKREFNHPPESKSGRTYWRSVEELANSPGFQDRLKREFPQGAAELEGDEISRRGFMKFMGASLAHGGHRPQRLPPSVAAHGAFQQGRRMGNPRQCASLRDRDAAPRRRASTGGHLLQWPSDQARGQSARARLHRHDRFPWPGRDPRSLRPRPLQSSVEGRRTRQRLFRAKLG